MLRRNARMRQHFSGEFSKFGGDCIQFRLPSTCDRVVLSRLTAHDLRATNKETVGLQPMQQRVDCPRAEGIAVSAQLRHHAGAEDRLLRCVIENVNACEGEKDITDEIDHCYPVSIMLTWLNPVMRQGCEDSHQRMGVSDPMGGASGF